MTIAILRCIFGFQIQAMKVITPEPTTPDHKTLEEKFANAGYSCEEKMGENFIIKRFTPAENPQGKKILSDIKMLL